MDKLCGDFVIPVIFFHLGEQDYFESTIRIAQLNNNHVIVLGNQGDVFKQKHPKVSFFNQKDYFEDENYFRKIYKHMHSGEPESQIICYTRWFIIRNFIIKNNIDTFFHADSDLAILNSVNNTYENLGKPNLALSTQQRQPEFRLVASGHSSYFTKESIVNLCNFFIDSYKESNESYQKLVNKFNWHKQNGIGGGVCDMTQLYLFGLKNNVKSLTMVNDNSCFDDNINSSENYFENEYKMQDNLKKMILIDKKFYFENFNDQKIQANTIHCQGRSKNLLFLIEKNIK